MIWLIASVALAFDGPSPQQAAALRAVNLDRGPDEMRGTAEDRADAWSAACQLGWRPACNPFAWTPTCTGTVDPVGCVAVGWASELQGDASAAVAAFTSACDAGFARGCAEVARVREEPESQVAACDAGVGAACRWSDRPEDACRLGDALGCVAAGDLPRGCELGHGPACVAWSDTLAEDPALARSVIQVTERACALGSPEGCVRLGEGLLAGSGVPADADAASRIWWTVCDEGHGPACRYLAESVLEDEARGIAMLPRDLYQRGCDLGDAPSCTRLDSFGIDERRSVPALVAATDLDWGLAPSIRPFLGGSVAVAGQLSIPRVGRRSSRRRLSLRVDVGSADFLLGLEDRYAETQDHNLYALDWRQKGDPIGLLVAVGGFNWFGAPDFGDDPAAWALDPERQRDVNAAALRFDVLHERLFGPNTGVGLSISSLLSETSHSRAVLGITHDREPGDVVVMDAGRFDVAGWVGVSPESQAALGAVVTAERVQPLLRGPAGHPLLSLAVDGLASLRWGDVPDWLEHHAPARLSPNVGVWSLLRGQPASRLAGTGLARGRVELRWSLGEYHGLYEPIELFIIPFGEVAVVQRSFLDLTPVGVFGDGGASLALSWGDHTSFRSDLILVPEEDGLQPRFGLVLEQVLRPW